MIITGDCLEEMRKMEANSISAIVTDPPYGLGFMGKEWDAGLPYADIWKEALRVCKPGSFLLAFGGTRTYHRLTCAIEDAGWEIRDCIQWIYGSGFPKSHNHFGIEGYGTALKPAYEPIIMAMKPCDGTFKQNAEKWGHAGINIDECRISHNEPEKFANRTCGKSDGRSLGKYEHADILATPNQKGRWPANVIFDEEAAKMLDDQSGQLKSGGGDKGNKTQDGGYGKKYGYIERIEFPSIGGASRFFYCAKASSRERNEGLENLPFQQGGIKNDSGRGFSESDPMKEIKYKNNHPTVKPLKLMEYLITLVMPPTAGILLDPFAGSGTTILAAKRLGFNAIGIEKCPEYAEIARARLASHKPEVKKKEKDLIDLVNEKVG